MSVVKLSKSPAEQEQEPIDLPVPTAAEALAEQQWRAKREIDRQTRRTVESGVRFVGAWLATGADFKIATAPDALIFSARDDDLAALVELSQVIDGSGGFPAPVAFQGRSDLTCIRDREGQPVVVSSAGLLDLIGRIRLHRLTTKQIGEKHLHVVTAAVDPDVVDITTGWPDPEPENRLEPDAVDAAAAVPEVTHGDEFPTELYDGRYFYHHGLRQPFWYDELAAKWLGSRQRFQFGQSASLKTGAYFELTGDIAMSADIGLLESHPLLIESLQIKWKDKASGVIAVLSDGATLAKVTFANALGIEAANLSKVALPGRAVSVRILSTNRRIRYSTGRLTYRQIGENI